MTGKRTGFLWATLALLFAACGPAATATPVPSPTPQATVRLSPGPTVAPTATPQSASVPTPQPAPTSTPPRPATTAGPTRGGIIKYPITGDPTSWDPVNRLFENLATKGNVFSRLLSLWNDPPQAGCKSELTPWLVKEWKWVDDRTAQFTIHQGVKFHNKPPVNGREVTAQDVAFSLERWRTQDWLGPKFKLVEAIEAVDKYTFRMKASFSWGGMVLESLGHDYGPVVLAQEAGGAKGELWETPQKSWIGSGAFTFEQWVPGVKWVLARNPGYWKEGRPLADGLEFWVMPDLSTQMAAMRSGRINTAGAWGDPQAEDVLRSNPDFQVFRCPTLSTFPGNLFMNNEGPPFSDVRVRRALSMALDREAIVKGPHGGKAVISAILRPGMPYALSLEDLSPQVRQYVEYHPDRAKALLAEAGYTNGFDTVINTNRGYTQHNHQAVWEAVAEMLGRVGIRAKLNFMDRGRYVATVIQANYPVGEMGTSPVLQTTPEDGHALANPSFKYAGTANRSRVNDPEYERLYEQFISTIDETKRNELARQLQTRQVEQTYRVVMPWVFDVFVARPELRITGFRSSPAQENSPLFETAWIAR
ncbi:MAG: hypothetical protein HYY01_09630 [Chloroflexi bacterium]|nr:hypothetical protein [Chloroflexota bacterium]